MSLQHIQKNSPRLLPKPAKFEKNPPNGYRVIRKTKCGAGGAGGAGSSPIHKQASLAGRLITSTTSPNMVQVPSPVENFRGNQFRGLHHEAPTHNLSHFHSASYSKPHTFLIGLIRQLYFCSQIRNLISE